MIAEEIFKAQGVPTVTLVREPVSARDANDFDSAILEGGRLIRVIGPSKSGKTVFVMTKAPKDVKILRVSVSGLANGAAMWTRVLATARVEASRQTTDTIGGNLGAELVGKAEGGLPLLAKASAEVKGQAQIALTRSISVTTASDPLQSVIEFFAKEPVWIFIEDFHYASAGLQAEAPEQIKHAAEEGVQLLMAFIPGRSEDVLLTNPDLTGRLLDIQFSYWSTDELAQIAELGFPALNVQLVPGGAKRLALEAAGTPQLMQALCLALAKELRPNAETASTVRVDVTDDLVSKICKAVARRRSDSSQTLEQMRMGPTQRGTTRKIYVDIDGKQCDVYQLIVRAFGMNPPAMRFTATDLQSRVDSLVGDKVANLWASVGHIADIANGKLSDRKTADFPDHKIDFGASLRWVTILDPYLWFATRWSSSEDPS
ncbi:hypothetical protein [Stenotrophomonas maltophilia]|uniref:Uncharacterized protein n=1 Tax=Stenotrophomonas maltophilia TaxID=40324 RepID=A0AAJ2JBE8_STEMA|nr:hypothetical protein [Stenotrophomonas maltophilia]MDT3467897.1 hypothetical protein [Stenotrophomonas maltophilia]